MTHEREAHADRRAAARLVRRALEEDREPRPEVRLFEVWTPVTRIGRIEDITDAGC